MSDQTSLQISDLILRIVYCTDAYALTLVLLFWDRIVAAFLCIDFIFTITVELFRTLQKHKCKNLFPLIILLNTCTKYIRTQWQMWNK